MSLPRSPQFFLGLAVIALIVGAGIVYWVRAIHPYESTDNTYLKAHMSPISPRLSGYVREVHFTDNQPVQPGELLVVIDDRDFQARVTQAESQVMLETARIQTLETGKRAQKTRISQEQANITAIEAELERLAKDLKRFGNLAKEGAISTQVRDGTEAAHKQAVAQAGKYQAAYQEAGIQLAALDAQIVETKARLKMAEAALELARIDLANTRITAPLAGIIGNRSVQVGQLVQPGRVLAYLIPGQELFVEANFKETQIGDIRPGQPVDIWIDAYPNQAFAGVVDSFAPASGSEFSLLPPENATGNFTKIVRRVPVKILFKPGTDTALLRPGLSTVVKVRVR